MPLTDTWWKRHPEWLEHELAELDAAGICWEQDKSALENGIVQLNLSVRTPDGEDLKLVATYPDFYPYFRFEVAAPTDLGLKHHQHPGGGNLCLLPRGTHQWRSSYTVAKLLQERLADVLRAGRSADAAEVAQIEQEQAEPFSDYYPYAPSMVIVQPGWSIPDALAGGTLIIGTNGPEGLFPQRFVRGAVLEVRNQAGDVVAEAEAALKEAFRGPQLESIWVRVSEPIPLFDQQNFLEHLLKEFPQAHLAPANRVDGGWIQMWGVLFPEEVGHRIMGKEGWAFVCCFDEKRNRLPAQKITIRAAKKSARSRGEQKKKGRR